MPCLVTAWWYASAAHSTAQERTTNRLTNTGSCFQILDPRSGVVKESYAYRDIKKVTWVRSSGDVFKIVAKKDKEYECEQVRGRGPAWSVCHQNTAA